MALLLFAYPNGQHYRLPNDEEAGAVTKALAGAPGNRGFVVPSCEMPDPPRNPAVVLIKRDRRRVP